jgi:hypothetical protein
MLLRRHRAVRTRRSADDRRAFAGEGLAARGPAGHIDRVLQHARHRSVVFGRDEQQRVGLFYFGLEAQTRRREVGVVVLVVKRQIADLQGAEREPIRCQPFDGPRELAIEGGRTQAADDDRDVGRCHGYP